MTTTVTFSRILYVVAFVLFAISCGLLIFSTRAGISIADCLAWTAGGLALMALAPVVG